MADCLDTDILMASVCRAGRGLYVSTGKSMALCIVCLGANQLAAQKAGSIALRC